MTVRELVIPFQRNKRPKSVTTAGRPLILTFLSYIEVDSLRASRSARNKSHKSHLKIQTLFFDKTTTSITLTAHILVLEPRGQLGYLNSNLMLRRDGHFKKRIIC